jgi:hypothetical protein
MQDPEEPRNISSKNTTDADEMAVSYFVDVRGPLLYCFDASAANAVKVERMQFAARDTSNDHVMRPHNTIFAPTPFAR